MTTQNIDGHVATGFRRIAEAFRQNFEEGGDTGAACTVYQDGEQVVDLWGGMTQQGSWSPNTRSVLFSVSKGITAICLLMASEEGHLDLDAPVAHYWPEFSSQGKD
jgi:CubicO group peptidase (beta-lactamase class C family)